MIPKYCLPIIKQTKHEVLTEIQKQRDDYNFFEVWIDYVADLDNVFLKKIKNDLGNKLVIVFRRLEGKAIELPIERRKEVLKLFDNSSCLIDLDIEQQKEELTYVNEKKLSLQVISSYHNFSETPPDDELIKLIAEMEGYSPTIYKIASFCQSETDAVRLLQLLILLREQKRCIILGMGEFGKITRVFGTLWGNEMVFAPETLATSSASGQLTFMQLQKIFTIMH